MTHILSPNISTDNAVNKLILTFSDHELFPGAGLQCLIPHDVNNLYIHNSSFKLCYTVTVVIIVLFLYVSESFRGGCVILCNTFVDTVFKK